MNYYEELGVGRDASIEEIRQAYKTLARLLHPDGHSDEKLRAMAERQMKRINEAIGVLADPRRRAEYDENLGGRRLAAQSAQALRTHARVLPGLRADFGPGWARLAFRNWFCILITAIASGTALVWHGTTGAVMPAKIGPSEHSPELLRDEAVFSLEERTKEQPVTAWTVWKARSAARKNRATEATADESTIQAPAGPLPPLNEEMPSKVTASLTALRSAPEASKPSASKPPATKAKGDSFTGDWLYMPTPEDVGDPGQYPASYVELVLAEENGNLAGRCRAMYRVPDRAISPEVRFRVEGELPSGKSARLVWTSAEGAKGELEVTLRSPDVMVLTWWTTEFGSKASLSSGSAVLMRLRQH